jgi:ribulose-phosphate 3-epimerase
MVLDIAPHKDKDYAHAEEPPVLPRQGQRRGRTTSNPTGVKAKMAKLICPSIFSSVSFENLQDVVRVIDESDTDIFHLDVLDGSFVSNFGLSPQDIQVVRKHTDKLIDVHLMIMNPGRYVEKFAALGCDIIYIHPEAEIHAARTLSAIRALGKHPGIAVNPGTSIAMIEELMPLIDYVMVMGVNPGFAGQKFIPHVERKIEKFSALRKAFDFKMILDGGVSFETIERFNTFDLDGFIAGYDIIANRELADYKAIFARFRSLIS